MPLYEYQCDACGHRFESIQRFSDAPLTECPKCGGAIRKLQSAPAIQFKGSGWYITDYARKDSQSSDGSTHGAKGDGKNESGEGKTTETKADEKAEKQAEKNTERNTEKKTEPKADGGPAASGTKPT